MGGDQLGKAEQAVKHRTGGLRADSAMARSFAWSETEPGRDEPSPGARAGRAERPRLPRRLRRRRGQRVEAGEQLGTVLLAHMRVLIAATWSLRRAGARRANWSATNVASMTWPSRQFSKARALLGARGVDLVELGAVEVGSQRKRGLDDLLEPFPAPLADQIVGVLAGRQRRDARAAARTDGLGIARTGAPAAFRPHYRRRSRGRARGPAARAGSIWAPSRAVPKGATASRSPA